MTYERDREFTFAKNSTLSNFVGYYWLVHEHHELILKRGPKFRVACTPVLPRLFCRLLLFSISIFYFNLFPASETVRLAWKQHVLLVPYGAELLYTT